MVSVSFLKSAKKSVFFEPFFQRAQEEYAYLKDNFADSPAYVSGWFHDFCCPHCASQLKADPIVKNHSFQGGNRYRCSACGCETEGNATLDEAWVYSYRQKMVGALSGVALYALLGDGEALRLIVKFVDFYAQNYHAFPIHGKHAGRGKIMAQSLDEAVYLLTLLRALFSVRDRIDAEKRAEWKQQLFLPMCEFLLEQTDFHQIHNIALWMRCAVGAAALFLEDDELLSRAIEPPYGIRAQVEEGYTKDSIWNECSFHYHYYSTEALTHFLLYYREKAPNDPLFDRLADAYTVPVSFSHDGYTVPSLSDGWYPLSLKRYAPQIVSAAEILRSPALLKQLAILRERAPESLIGTGVLLHCGELLCDTNIDVPSVNFAPCALLEDSRLAAFHGPFTALFRVGNRRFSHMHDDYLSLILPGISDDLGTPGYAHPMCDTYYRRSYSHNALCADGKSQPHVYRDTVILAHGEGVRGVAESLWEGIDAERTVAWENGVLFDRLRASSSANHVYDWFFHVQGKLLNAEADAQPLTETEVAYEHLSEVRFLGEGKGRCLCFETALGILELEIHSEAELFLAKSPSNPATLLRETVLLRVAAPCAEFCVSYRLR